MNLCMEQRLVAAAGAGDISTVRKLLRKNVPTGVKDDYGRTALSLASSGGHSEIVRLLLEAGADVNQKLGSNVTALHVASKNNQATIVKYLVLGGAQLDAANVSDIKPVELCRYGSDCWNILSKARKGNMPDVEVESEVPVIPSYSLPVKKMNSEKLGTSGKKGKKSGKKQKNKGGKRKR